MISTSSLLAGLLCPIFGTMADLYAVRKLMTFVSALLSIIFLTIFAYCNSSVSIHWLLFYAGTAITFSSLSHAFYNSLIMLVSGPHELVKVACIQASVGSLGAAALMTALGLHNTEDLNRNYTLFAFGFAALWFVVLALPMWFWLKEDPPARESTWQVRLRARVRARTHARTRMHACTHARTHAARRHARAHVRSPTCSRTHV